MPEMVSSLQNVSSTGMSNSKAFNASRNSTRFNTNNHSTRRELSPQVVGSAEFDRKKALRKLSRLGSDAREHASKLDQMIMTSDLDNLPDGKK